MDDFFEREWVRSVFSLSLERLRQECETRGKQTHFRLLEFYDIDEAGKELTYEQVGRQFGLKTSDVTNYLAYARREFRRIVLEQLREMTGSEEEFRREARTLLGSGRAMKWLSDQALDRLRAAAEMPDLSGTGYVLLDKLGEGGMGGVFRVQDTTLGRQVALKVIGIVDSSGELSARLLREAKIIARLEHPGIVPVHDVGTLPDGRVFYTMKLVQGQRLDQHAAELGGVPERLRTFQKICEAVSFAHAHDVVHRDLKPQNIMVGRFGEVLVMDWGLAKLLNTRTTDARCENIGTRKSRDEQALAHGHRARCNSRHARLHGAGAGARGGSGHRSAR